jgi:hypothetical protein
MKVRSNIKMVINSRLQISWNYNCILITASGFGSDANN